MAVSQRLGLLKKCPQIDLHCGKCMCFCILTINKWFKMTQDRKLEGNTVKKKKSVFLLKAVNSVA